jgi:coenzyme F420 biosynthesis associated uncharacterized protein
MNRLYGGSGSPRRSLPPVDRRLLAAGLVAGAAVGAWAGTKVRGMVDTDAPSGVIDWEHARSIAINMNRGHTLTGAERERLDHYYSDLVKRCIPIVTEFTGSVLPNRLDQTFAFDRVDWINANLDAFKVMFAPIEALSETPEGRRSVAAALWGGFNRTIISTEVGLLLGYLARRVLGQYDLALLGREPVTSGKLYYVEPNIQHVETTLGLPREEFRMWLALHETTHAFEFEAHPWVRGHFNSLLEHYFEFFKQDVDQLKQGMRGLKIFVDRARTRNRDDSSWIEALMVPEQRALFTQMQALMCIVEGYSNYVMNGVGRELLPNYEAIARRFEQRQRKRGLAEQLFARLTGLDMKMEQYRLGERFINQIAEQRGHDAVKRIWEGPANLPTMAEVRAPQKWVERVLDNVFDPVPTGPAVFATIEGESRQSQNGDRQQP